ncbi:MAG: phosphoserine phosphatase SerB [Colwellia sp.]|nr:phosphoserine phosphatase SerB [Colwellia sp.]MCW8863746.1 phosphoserine phosphatase SerB [Colwellia sp.]MCW9081558.1 phosphoserine phosphatase SerB [Colwellia sp.]
MSFSTTVPFSTQILSLSLATFFDQHPIKQDLPICCSLSDEAISFSGEMINKLSQQELVVFADISIENLLAVQSVSNISIHSLTAINTRNQQTSYRFTVSCDDFVSARKAIADFALSNGLEIALIENAPRLNEPGLLVMDMDSTTIEIECIDEIAKLAGVGEQVAAVTELAMQGELDFAQSLHQRVATLNEAPETILAEVAKNIPLMAGLETLITELKKYNWRIAIASGGFTYFADHLKNLLQLDATFANELEIIDGKLTGKVLGSVVDAQVKADSLTLLAEQYQIPSKQTVAMGDGANDLVMMAAAGFGVAFHAKPIVLAQADSTINQQGLDCLLHWLA